MAGKRTRKEKIIAKLRRQTESRPHSQVVSNSPLSPLSLSNRGETVVKKIEGFYAPEIVIPMKLIASDLTKTVIVTILALILQIAISIYFSHGGWQFVKSFLRI
jgi:hypothetical protein